MLLFCVCAEECPASSGRPVGQARAAVLGTETAASAQLCGPVPTSNQHSGPVTRQCYLEVGMQVGWEWG